MTERTSPTGRLVFPHIEKPDHRTLTERMEEVVGRLVPWEAKLEPDKEEPKSEVLVFHLSSDLSQIELYALGALLHESGAKQVLLDLDPRGGILPSMRYYAHGRQIADMFAVPECLEPEGEPMKQNGRSAAYLKHDRSKRHGRR